MSGPVFLSVLTVLISLYTLVHTKDPVVAGVAGFTLVGGYAILGYYILKEKSSPDSYDDSDF